jgi:hypothetical protein
MSSAAGAATRDPIAIDRDLRAALWVLVVALGCCLSLFLTCRRLAGALVQPPSGAALVTAAIALALAAALLRQIGSPDCRSRLTFALPGIAPILLLAALTLPGTPAWSIVIAWFALIVSEGTSWLVHERPRRREMQQPLAADEPEIPAGLVQQVTRVRENNRETMHALASAEFASRDKLAVVHLAFCPPLAARPELTAHALDIDDAEVRITQSETFGARIEVRLPRADDQPRSALVEVLGSVTDRRDV